MDGPIAKKGNGLGVTAVVCASLFFLPVVPLIGLVLGIITLATGRSRALGIVSVCLGAFFTLFAGILAAIAIPAFVKYTRRAKTIEATMNTRRIGDLLLTLPNEQWAQLPDSDWTPPSRACPEEQYTAVVGAWRQPPWSALGFSLDGTFSYQYRLRHDGQGFVIEAQADLDCNGVTSHFQRRVTTSGVGPLERENELE